jgi:hypothetical protein
VEGGQSRVEIAGRGGGGGERDPCGARGCLICRDVGCHGHDMLHAGCSACTRLRETMPSQQLGGPVQKHQHVDAVLTCCCTSTTPCTAGEWGFNDFLRRGLIEYLDVNEENVSLIALYEQNCTPRVSQGCIMRLQGGVGAMATLHLHRLPPGPAVLWVSHGKAS